MTVLTQEMLDAAPGIDIHVHVQGTITARTAWKLGVMNGLIDEEAFDETGKRTFKGERLNPDSGFEYYVDMFNIEYDENGKISHIEYNFQSEKDNVFTVFDRIMAVVQGHRHRPGGIQSENDYRFVMREYLKSCLEQNITYTELQQNIKISNAVYPSSRFPHMSEFEKRVALYDLLAETKAEFEEAGVRINFLNCYNKTKAADNPIGHDPTIEAVEWVLEAEHYHPGLFKGIVSAGSEKDETGWPNMLSPGYIYARENGLLVETHSGEGIGSFHMMDCISTLQPHRNAHGYQAVEDSRVIDLLKENNVILLVSPRININLGCKIYMLDGVSTPKQWGGVKTYIKKTGDHPVFELMRTHSLEIALVSDDPGMGGIPYKEMVAELAGLKKPEELGNTPPLTAEEFCRCQLNAINRSVDMEFEKAKYIKQMVDFMHKFNLNIEHSALDSRAVRLYQDKLRSNGLALAV